MGYSREYYRKYRELNREKILENNRRYYKKRGPKTPNREVEHRASIKTKYGITKDQKDEMARHQRGLCAICSKKPNKLFIDHNHLTGKVRGLLCRECNLAFGLFKENKTALYSAVSYLERYQEKFASDKLGPDAQMMVRRELEDKLNLSIGEPHFIPRITKQDMRYPPPEGKEELVSLIKKRTDKKHVVITNGGKQALLASMYALKKVSGMNCVIHEPPYWPSFPTLAKMSGLSFNSDLNENPIKIITLPGNPQGLFPIKKDLYHIWDSVYAQPLYGFKGMIPNHIIQVESMSKAFGLSGARLGWLLTDDEKLAEAAKNYMEFTTSGVCVLSQNLAIDFFENAKNMDRRLHKARIILLKNGELFKKEIAEFVQVYYGVPKDGTGMFAWFLVKPEFQQIFSESIKNVDLLLVSGESCGMMEKGWYRMSMGHNFDYTKLVLTKLRKEIDSVRHTHGTRI